ncbi:MAG: hypothetical protein GY832_30300 [Chloroflexi bacterium]|nr:hypothetical protein [Chloroflexota bacterium]
MADFELEETLVDAERNRFLLDLLGAEGIQQLAWDAVMTEMEVNNATHANFQSTIRLCLQPLNASTTTAFTSGRPLPGDLSPVLSCGRCKRGTAGLVGKTGGKSSDASLSKSMGRGEESHEPEGTACPAVDGWCLFCHRSGHTE